MITEKLMASGSWSVTLKPSTPPSIIDAINPATSAFGIIVILPTWTPIESSGLTATALLGVCRYAGVYRNRSRDMTMIGGGLPLLLGDDQKKGPILSTAVTNTSAATLDTWVSAILPHNGVSKGTITNTGTSSTGSYAYVTKRAALEQICQVAGADWSIRPDSTGALKFTAGPSANVFTNYTTPQAIVSRRSGGTRDVTLFGLPATQLATDVDVEDITSKTYLLATRDGGMSVGSATNGSWTYTGLDGSALAIETVVNASDVTRGNETTAATNAQAATSSVRRQIVLSTNIYDVAGDIKVGDRIYVYDPVSGIFDTANSVTYGGSEIAPLMVRCMGLTWPIRQGMGVYFLPPTGATPTPVDLTPYVQWEDADSTVEIGAIQRTIVPKQIGSTASATGVVSQAVVSEAWTSYTPTYANLSLGNGTVDAGYYRIGRKVVYRGAITFGSTTSVTGAIQVSLPVAAKASTWSLGTAVGEDNSASFARTVGAAEINPAIFATGVHFASSGNADWTATVPFTWATSDILRWTITYEASAS